MSQLNKAYGHEMMKLLGTLATGELKLVPTECPGVMHFRKGRQTVAMASAENIFLKVTEDPVLVLADMLRRAAEGELTASGRKGCDALFFKSAGMLVAICQGKEVFYNAALAPSQTPTQSPT